MRWRGYWLVLLAAVLWGTNGTAQAFAPPEAQPVIIGAVRIILGGLGLLAVALKQRALSLGSFLRGGWPFWPTLAAALSMAAYQLCFFAGVNLTGVAVGTIVGIGSSPILGGLMGFLVRGERPGRRWGLATLLGVLGSALLISAGSRIRVNLLGVALALGAGLAYAVFTTASKGLLERHPSEAVMAVSFCLGGLFLTPLLWRGGIGWLAQPRGAAVALHLGLVTAALAYTLFGRGLRLVPIATAATLTLGEPLTAGLLGLIVLREPITLTAGLGVLLIFGGLLVLSLDRGAP